MAPVSRPPTLPAVALAVIAKEPVAGRVKTRLCPPFTAAEAAELAAAALHDTLAVVAATPAVRRVLVLDGRPGPWIPPGFTVIPQHGTGLGARLAAAFTDCARSGPGPVVLVGMDTPQLTPATLAAAGDAVAGPGARRAVLGPALDGGYWLLGLSSPDPAVFAGVPMSVADTGRRQVAGLVRRGFAVRLLEALRDVDTAADAAAVSAAAPHTTFARHHARLVRASARAAVVS
jgi:rSAM/selenodomain-associated transferase 1